MGATLLPTVLLPLSGCGSEEPRTPHARAIARACQFLWTRQKEDGGWHGEVVGLLKSGQSLTALVLFTLLQVPRAVATPSSRGANKAAGFVTRNMRKGGLGFADEWTADYPNYATSLAARALHKLSRHGEAVREMRGYLLGQQFQESLGWKPEDPAFGGWGMGGAPRQAPHAGHMDLSMTRWVLEALADLPPDSTGDNKLAFARARRFLARCQNDDGGFYFSPVKLGANKGGRDGEEFKSYGSTTADGILSLLATGLTPDSKDVQRARDWLVAHHRQDQVPGIPKDSPTNWHQGLRFYYLAASARTLKALAVNQAPTGKDWRGDLVNTLVTTQRKDGSWVNPVQTQKEDEPALATSLALQALTSAWRQD